MHSRVQNTEDALKEVQKMGSFKSNFIKAFSSWQGGGKEESARLEQNNQLRWKA